MDIKANSIYKWLRIWVIIWCTSASPFSTKKIKTHKKIECMMVWTVKIKILAGIFDGWRRLYLSIVDRCTSMRMKNMTLFANNIMMMVIDKIKGMQNCNRWIKYVGICIWNMTQSNILALLKCYTNRKKQLKITKTSTFSLSPGHIYNNNLPIFSKTTKKQTKQAHKKIVHILFGIY